MATWKVKSRRSRKYKECSPTPFHQLVHTTVLVEYGDPTINGHVVLVVRLRGNRRRSITHAIMDLRTFSKSGRAEGRGLGRGSGTNGDIRQGENNYHQKAIVGGNIYLATLGEGSEAGT